MRPCRNIELKARCDDLTRAETACRSLGARDAGLLIQTDTYYRVPSGRLKIREIEPDRAELIWYERADECAARPCDYMVVPVVDATAVHGVLSSALGVRGQVRKRRRVFLWHNVRIHLDQVDGLGNFIEFEAVVSESDPEPISHQRMSELQNALSIAPQDLAACGYAELLGL